MTSDSEPQAPKVGVALPDGELREKVLRSLQRTDVSVERVPQGGDIWEALSDQDVDVLVIRRTQLARDGLERLQGHVEDQDGPGIVVVSDGEDPAERASIIAAGATSVLDANDSASELGKAIEVLAEAESQGGREGPERSDSDAQPRLADFLSRSPYMRDFLDVVRQVTDAKSSLLITGETGVGKERLARAIHAESIRSEGPFVSVNCGALPEQLLESELFGHEQGAFTGAESRRKGRFELADGGTIFLDEIGEMPKHLQVKLLTVLQRGEVRRVGGAEPVSIDIRVMAATNRRVEEEVESGKFREDLYYRLNVIRLEIPSLRERVQDIPDLVGFLIAHYRQSQLGHEVERISEEALQALMRHSWPGNMRELINVVERCVLLTDGEEIGLEALPPELRGGEGPGDQLPGGEFRRDEARTATALPPNWRDMTIKEVRNHVLQCVEREYLEALLRETEGKIGETAQRAGIGTRALYDRMRRFDLRKEDFRP